MDIPFLFFVWYDKIMQEWNDKKVMNNNNILIINDNKIYFENNLKRYHTFQHINKTKNILNNYINK